MLAGSRQRKTVWLTLFAIFIIPLMLAGLLFAKGQTLLTNTTNRGQLLTPPIDIDNFSLQSDKGTIDISDTHGKWTLLYVSQPICDKSCAKRLYFLKQIHIATGKNQDRVRCAVLTTPKTAKHPTLTKLLTKRFPSFKQFYFADQTVKQAAVKKPGFDLTPGATYLVDPKGNLMMYYQPKSNPADIYHDLTHLLRVSQIG